MTATIEVRLDGRLGDFHLDAAFEAPGSGITALFGPSGCGKTSILRSLAGLQRVPGRIAVAGEVWQDGARFVKPHRRAVGYVFQEASLFPHLSVRQNLEYGLKRVRAGDPGDIRFADVVALLGLAHLVDRDPAYLSGGERQRVSIGRALLSRPRLLLMDEPLSALDRMAKDEILPYLETLHSQLSLPILFVTHDFSEVLRLADHLVVLAAGRVVSSRPLDKALTDAGSPLGLARDFASVLEGTVVALEPDGLAVVATRGVEILAVGSGLAPGRRVRLRVAASDVSLSRQADASSSILNRIPATIRGLDPVGTAETNVRLSFAGQDEVDLVARVSNRSVSRLDLKAGERIVAQVKGVSVMPTGSER